MSGKHLGEHGMMTPCKKCETLFHHKTIIFKYEVLVIWESDYKNDKQGTIDKCINFLTL